MLVLLFHSHIIIFGPQIWYTSCTPGREWSQQGITIIQVCVRHYAVNGGSEILASDWPSQFSFLFSLFNARAVKIKQPRCVGWWRKTNESPPLFRKPPPYFGNRPRPRKKTLPGPQKWPKWPWQKILALFIPTKNIFCKKIGPKRSIVASAVVRPIYSRLYGATAAN